MTRGRRKARQKGGRNFVICHPVSFSSGLRTPLAISAVVDFSASPFYVFFRNGVSSTSRTSDGGGGGVSTLSSPFRPDPFVANFRESAGDAGGKGRTREDRSVKYFGSVNRWKVYPFPFWAAALPFSRRFFRARARTGSSAVLIARVLTRQRENYAGKVAKLTLRQPAKFLSAPSARQICAISDFHGAFLLSSL